MTVIGGDTARLAASLPGMARFAAAPASDALRICLDCTLEVPPCQWHHSYHLSDGVTECRFGTDTEGVYWHTTGGHVMRYDPLRPDEVLCGGMEDAAMLRYVLWVAYGLGALPRGRVLIHSSAVVCHGRTVLCLGESGTGKSTHTRLWIKNIEGCHLLNDDGPVLAVEDGVAVAYGSPWSGKTPCFRAERYPVAGLVRIVQAPYNRIQQLHTLKAFTAVQPSCPPLLAHEERSLDRLVEFISSLLSATQVYRLECLPDDEAAQLSHHTIMQ